MLVLGIWSRIKNSFNNFIPKPLSCCPSILAYRLITLLTQSMLPLRIASATRLFGEQPTPRKPTFRIKKGMTLSIGWFSPGESLDHHIIVSEHAHPKHNLQYTMLEKVAFGDLVCYLPRKKTPYPMAPSAPSPMCGRPSRAPALAPLKSCQTSRNTLDRRYITTPGCLGNGSNPILASINTTRFLWVTLQLKLPGTRGV